MKKITLKSKRDASVRRFHPWVFSGAIAKEEAGIEDGEWVEVRSQKGDLLGMGHYQDGSIKVRILSFTSVDPELAFWKERMQKALEYRLRLGFQAAGPTNCFRLIHGEGDGLSGLIIDIYHRTAVIQCHTIGMYRNRAFIAEALQSLQGWELDTIFDKSVDSLPVEYATGRKNEFLLGQGKDDIVLENGHRFHVNWVQGQKTGFFLDQRDNRQL